MRPFTPHYVLTQLCSIVLGKHFFSSSCAAESCFAVIHSLLGDHILTNTSHSQTLHCLVSILEWWIDLIYASRKVKGLDCKLFLPSLVPSRSVMQYLTLPLQVLDCIPDFTTKVGRSTWLTMACTAIFFNSLNSSTYKQADGKTNRSIAEVRCGPPMTAIEGITVGFAQTGAAWVFTQVGRQGYESREDEDFETRRADRLESFDGWPDDPWNDMLQLPWVPVRYRYPVRFVLFYACAIVTEYHRFLPRNVPYPLKLQHLKTRLALDVGNFLGGQARALLEVMMEQIPDRLSDGLGKNEQNASLLSFIYEERFYQSDFVDKPCSDDWAPPTFTNEFNERLKSLRDWKVM